jgi:hypothetical protein
MGDMANGNRLSKRSRAGLPLVGVVHPLVGAWGLGRARALAFAASYATTPSG